MNEQKDFTHLHVHTDYSLLDGLGKVEDYVKHGLSLGMKALAFTDHGTMAGLVTAYDTCKKYGMKFIGGFEAYIAPHGTSRFERKSYDNRAYNHLIILFKNEIGYKNGCILLTRSNTEGFYYKPRIDFELLKEHSEGLVILSACVAGSVPSEIIKGNMDKAKEIILQYKEVFGEDYYLEIQDHGLPQERMVIDGIMRLSKECSVKIVATNDCHYVHPEDKEAHDWLLCMQTGCEINDRNRMQYEGAYHLKSKQEMLDLFPYCPEAVYNTQEIVEKCDFEFEYGNYRMPKVKIPDKYNGDYFKYLEDEAWVGFQKRYPVGHAKREEAIPRLKYELSIIKQMNFAEYFLDIRKTIQWAKSNNILVGPGRGSGAGSCMNYCLEITDIEPLQYDLLFERFLNPERISMPDIDTDYEFLRKDDVINEEANDYGVEHFAKIRTFGTMQAKAVLKSCTKVSGIENHVAVGNKLAKFIVDNHSLEEEWELNPDLRAYVQSNELIEKIWEIALKLEETKKSAGTHACGHIPTPVPCEELFPCAVDQETGYLVCEYDMTQAEHLGNLKKDLLMLRNLTIIDTAQKEILKRTGKKIPLWTDEILNDKKALEMVSRGDTDGIFQLESEGMKSFMRQLQPSCFEDIIAGVALYRPGPMSYIPDYIKNKHHPDEIQYPTPESSSILAPTYGIIVYQEQVILLVQKLAGFSMGRADVVRNAMGKKKQYIMDQEKPHFIYGDEELGIKGCVNNGISLSVAEKIWDQMEDFGKYAFNKSHAAAYAAITMQTAYLKANYPHEFAVGLLSSVMDNSDKLMKYIVSFKQMGIHVLPPDVTKSEYGFTIEGENDIRFGLFAVKGVGVGVAKKIPEERRERPYKGFEDFIERHLDFNKTAFENLAKCGAFDSFGYTRRTLIENLEPLLKSIKKEAKNNDENQLTLFDFGIEGTKTTCEIKEYPEYSFLRTCRNEKDSTGMYISGHPVSFIEEVSKKHGSVNIEDIAREDSVYEHNNKVSICGIITKISRKITKTGKPMAIIQVEDTTDSIAVLMFEQTMQQYFKEIDEDTLVFMTGKIRGYSGDYSLILDTVQVLHEKPKILWIGTNEESLFNLKKKAVQFSNKHHGFGDYLYIASKRTRQKEMIGEISVSDEVLTKAKIAFGVDNVMVTEKKE